MPAKPTERGENRSSPRQKESCGSVESGYDEAIDLLAAWIVEDSEAVANSFDTDPATVLKDALRRTRSEIVSLEGN
jgi:hypothetical protein